MPEETLATGDTGSQQQETVTESVTETAEKPAEEQQEKATEQNVEKSTETTQDGEKDTKPTEYTDFALPEGMTMNSEVLDEFKPIALDVGLTQEQAQKMVDIYSKAKQQDFENEVAYRKDAFNELVKDIKADKKIGEEGYGKINSMLTKFGGDEAPKLFEASLLALSGMDKGVAKQLVGVYHKLAEAAGDDQMVFGQPNTKDLSAKTLLYGDTFKK